MRIGLGCMRLSTEHERDDARAHETLRAALAAGVALFDTAHAYGIDQADAGHNERLVGRVVRAHGAGKNATHDALATSRAEGAHRVVRVITKCGMRRDGGAWIPDGRAGRIAEDVEASLAALDGVPIDTMLLHAPDPRVSLATTARALARVLEKGQAARVGVSNVSRKQLEEIAQHAPIGAVEVALGAYDDLAIRSGVVGYCLERGIELLAYAPLGGPRRVGKLARDQVLARVRAKHAGTSTIEVFLAYLLAVSEKIVPIVGARRPETIAGFVAASELVLRDDELVAIDARFPVLGAWRRPTRTGASARATYTSTSTTTTGGSDAGATGETSAREVVLLMGVPGAGKSSAAETLVRQGYERLNRDTLGGTLRGIVRRLDERLHAGAARIVLDNTYVTRATRNDVVRVAHTHGAEVRCVFFDTPAHEAQINVVARMLQRFGHVLGPAELKTRAREDPSALAPHAVHRMTRDLEPPADDEGFSAVEIVRFVRRHAEGRGRSGLALSLDASEEQIADALAVAPPDSPCLLFGWRPGADEASHARARAVADTLARASGRLVELALCPHPAGPPICWCRPPLPGLWLAFADRHGLDVRESVLVGRSAADRALASALGLRFSEIAR